MLGYTQLDQCRRKYLLEFFNEHPKLPDVCCDNDTELPSMKVINRRKLNVSFHIVKNFKIYLNYRFYFA